MGEPNNLHFYDFWIFERVPGPPIFGDTRIFNFAELASPSEIRWQRLSKLVGIILETI